jgi:hypothetical protein
MPTADGTRRAGAGTRSKALEGPTPPDGGYPVEGRGGPQGKERRPSPAAAQGRRNKYLAPKTGWGGPAAGVLAPILAELAPPGEEQGDT